MEQPKIEFHKEKEKLDDRCGIRCIQFGAKEAFQSKSVRLNELFKLVRLPRGSARVGMLLIFMIIIINSMELKIMTVH